MTKLKYILKSLKFFKKQHLAVLAGTIISTAVLTGALIVGDSVKFSLSQIVERRLGKIQFALQSGDRFVRAKLATEISDKLKVKSASVLLLEGIAKNPENEYRINKIQVLGLDSCFNQLAEKEMPELKNDEAVISENVAEKLHLNVNDEFVLRVEKLSVIPLNSPFSTEEVPSVSFRLKIKAIADDKQIGEFSLKNNQVAPYNVFVSREYLSEKLDLNGMANAILVSENENETLKSNFFDKIIPEIWQTKDAGLDIHKLDNNGNYEITSDRIFIDKQISGSILRSIPEASTILSYLVNEIKLHGKTTPYSFVSAVSQGFWKKELANTEIIINEWLAEDLQANIGDTLHLKYFVIDSFQKLKEDSSNFVVKEIIPVRDSLINRSLMPKFPGFAKAITCMEWNTNMPIDMKKIRDKDEDYWNQFRGTPKAIISIEAGKKLWQNKFGDYTAIRFNNVKQARQNPDAEILNTIKPADVNLAFVDVKAEGLRSAKSGVDFGELFLSLSFFVIIAGIILTVMLFALNLEARKPETGILIGLGFSKKQIISLRISESAFTIIAGSILGVFTGIIYNYALLAGINTVWQDIVRTAMLNVSIQPATLIVGALSGFIISILAISIVTYKNLNKTAVTLINNNTQPLPSAGSRNKRMNILLIWICFVSSVAIVLYSVFTSVDQNAVLFLTAGGLFLVAAIAFVNFMMSRKKSPVSSFDFSKLAYKNIGRNKSRSLSLVALLSLGVFVVIITSANRKSFIGNENNKSSGTGGYSFWAETSVPVTDDLNSLSGKEKHGMANDTSFIGVDFVQIPSLSGDDASCLNLNQVNNPGILSIKPEIFNARKSFSFESLIEGADKNNPWLELNKSYGENIIPAFADQTVITWGVMKKIGDTLTYINESGKKIYMVLAGGLGASIFQGNILIADKYFKENFPSRSGSKRILIDVPDKKQETIPAILNNYLQDYGIEITKTTERLSQFYSVSNTYLTVFMILGGLGVIIGTIGIGIIVFRNMLDRKKEIAMLMAIGYTKQNIFSILFKENLFLISLGMIAGILSSIIGILPSLISKNFYIADYFVFWLIIIIFTNAIFWMLLTINSALKGKIIDSLRNE